MSTLTPADIAAHRYLVGCRCAVVSALLFAVLGCSPTLNWRSVSIGEIAVTLPCKPDRAQRAVTLAGYSMDMEMVGCEADGALFAVSSLRVPKQLSPDLLQAEWQAATLRGMRGQASQETPAGATGPKNLPLRLVSALGQSSDGQKLEASLGWATTGADMVHFAVYAPRLSRALTEPFFEGIRAP